MMASQGGVSRLAQMQMRFQQKQQREREQRKLELIGGAATKPPAADTTDHQGMMATTTTFTSSLGPGKVRQLFDERRRGTGFDKSLPLKPLNPRVTASRNTLTTTTTSSTLNGNSVTTMRRKQVTTVKQSAPVEPDLHAALNGIGDFNGNTTVVTRRNSDFEHFEREQIPLSNESFNISLKLPNVGKLSLDDRNNNKSPPQKIVAKKPITLKPVVTKKSLPPTPTERKPPSSGRSVRSTSSLTPTSRTRATPSTPTPPLSAKAKPAAKSTLNRMSATVKSSSEAVRTATPPAGTSECQFCGRFFNEDRLPKHQEICQKTMTKKRKPFDATKHRVAGTDAEKYLKKKRPSKPAATAYKPATTEAGSKKSNWRRKHEEFIAAIRAAKEVQAHLAKGGKLSDLPPPPPSENPDYIQCPHCSRRFNEGAATRHIPKCATMMHNKPKPGAASKRR